MMNKIGVIVTLMFVYIFCSVANAEQLKVISITYMGRGDRVYIITEKGGDNFWLDGVKISFNESLAWPVGEFQIENGRIWKINNSCTLFFKDEKQANEWLRYQEGISIKDNTNSNISASYSKSEPKGCFISSLFD